MPLRRYEVPDVEEQRPLAQIVRPYGALSDGLSDHLALLRLHASTSPGKAPSLRGAARREEQSQGGTPGRGEDALGAGAGDVG